MGGLRRETSSVHFLAHHLKGGLHTSEDSSADYLSEDSTDAGVDCPFTPKVLQQLAQECGLGGLLDLSFRHPDNAFCPGQACLRIRPNPQRPGVTKASALQSLVSGLKAVLSAEVDITVMYDFRDQGPSPQFTQVVSKFYLANMEDWSKRLKSTALLVKDNIFAAVARGPVHSFMKACHLGSSFVVCHGEAVAEDFIQVVAPSYEARQHTSSSGSSLTPPFVSVVNIVGGSASTCMASLEPLSSMNGAVFDNMGDSGKASLRAHTFHMLPNGDVRVIQSPAQSVVVSTQATTECAQKNSQTSSIEDPAGVAALRFDRPKEQLRHLVGIHFHVGELVVDAEAEADHRESLMPSTRLGSASGGIATSLGSSRSFPIAEQCASCLEGLGMLLLKITENIFGEDEDDEQGQVRRELPVRHEARRRGGSC